MENEEKIKKLEKENKKLNELLRNTIEDLEEKTLEEYSRKNHVPGGYYMMTRKAEKNLRSLQKNNSSASLVFSVIREHMQIGSNALSISNEALSKILNISKRSVIRATKYLKDYNYIQVIKIGNSNTYIVNEQIAFAGSPGQRKAIFSATVVAHEIDQEEGWNEVKKLKAVPTILDETLDKVS